MTILEKIKYLAKKRKFIFLIFFLLILFQLIHSFVYPSYDIRSDYWKTLEELSSYKDYSIGSFDNSIIKKIYPLISNYHISGDGSSHILLAQDFPQGYFRGKLTYIDRPLYSFLIYLTALPLYLINNSYAFTFVAAIILNLILFFLTVILFYLIVEKTISKRVALLSSILLIFSSFTRIWLNQPDTNIFGAFFVIITIYFIFNYSNKPSFNKLIIFSLILGVLMLGKMLFAIPLLILLLAIFFKRYKEGILSLVTFFIHTIFWYFLATKVFNLNYYTADSTTFNMYLINGWIFNIFHQPWQETFKIMLYSLPLFFTVIIYGFLSIPIIFAIVGFKKVSNKMKNYIYLFIFAFFGLFFAMNYYSARHAFLIFPVVYPLTVLGLDEISVILKKYGNYLSLVFYSAVFIFLIIISNINIFEAFAYGKGF